MSLLRAIEICLKATEIPPSRFGRDSVRDPRLVHDLRRGRQPGQRMERRVRVHLADVIAGLPDARRKEAERLLRLGGNFMRMMLRQANAALLRAVQLSVAAVDGDARLVIEAVASEPWASLTFKGERHEIHCRIEGVANVVARAAAKITADLEDATNIDVPGYFLADAELSETGELRHAPGSARGFCLRALLIEE